MPELKYIVKVKVNGSIITQPFMAENESQVRSAVSKAFTGMQHSIVEISAAGGQGNATPPIPNSPPPAIPSKSHPEETLYTYYDVAGEKVRINKNTKELEKKEWVILEDDELENIAVVLKGPKYVPLSQRSQQFAKLVWKKQEVGE